MVFVAPGFGGEKAAWRENKVPFFGICLGWRLSNTQNFRYADANSTEMNEHTEHPVVSLMEEQKEH
jgi:CTP synthase